MLFSISTTAFAALLPALAHAAPFEGANVPRQVIPGQFPPSLTKTGFKLVVNSTDITASALAAEVQFMQVYPYRVGAGSYAAAVSHDTSSTYWWNDTAPADKVPGAYPWMDSSIITDSGMQFPLGIAASGGNDPNFREVFFRQGSGDIDWRIAEPGLPLSRMLPGIPRETAYTLVVCKKEEGTAPVVPEYRLAIVQANTRDPIGVFERIPETCTSVKVLTQCADLPPLPESAQYTHDFAQVARCYADVAAIDWSQFSEAPVLN